MPALKLPPAPVRTPTARSSLASRWSRAAARALAVAPSTALRTSGRSMVMTSTPSRSWVCTVGPPPTRAAPVDAVFVMSVLPVRRSVLAGLALPVGDRSDGAESFDRGVIEAELAEHGSGVFAQAGRRAGADLLLLVQPHGAVDGEVRPWSAAVDRHQHLVGDELWVVCGFLECLGDPVGEPDVVEDFAPVGQRPGGELLVEQCRDVDGVGVSVAGVGEARVLGRFRMADRLEEQGDLL